MTSFFAAFRGERRQISSILYTEPPPTTVTKTQIVEHSVSKRYGALGVGIETDGQSDGAQ